MLLFISVLKVFVMDCVFILSALFTFVSNLEIVKNIVIMFCFVFYKNV